MALRTPLTAQPHLYIGDSTGRPLDYGRVYFGEPNKDPEFYPIDIYLDPEMTIAAAQPVRTKGGFMDVGGNLAELHAAEVIYSLKVLDQYGRQVFYKPEMYRNNVSDFLVDEITRATAAETLIAGNLTAETQRAVAAEKVIADAVVAEKDRAVAAEDALDIKHAALSSTINSLGGGKKAYTTYALMVADKNNIAANSSIDVTNDSDPTKNGTYSYDGAVFAKSIYDVETIVRTKVLNTFKTKALMGASVLPDGADAQVTNDTDNNGLYVKTAGAWVKSSYDPLTEAKVDSTIKADNAKQQAVKYTDSEVSALKSTINNKISNDNGLDLSQKLDVNGNVYAKYDKDAGLHLTYLEGTVQDNINSLQPRASNTQSVKRRFLTQDAQSYINNMNMLGVTYLKPPVGLMPSNYRVPDDIIYQFKMDAPTERLSVDTTYREDDMVVHPNIIECLTPIRGYKYILALNGLTRESEENPFIYGTNDLTNFTLLDGFVQPMDLPEGDGYLSDIGWTYDPTTGELVCFWRSTVPTGDDFLTEYRMRKTKDLMTWTEIEILFEPTLNSVDGITSPAILYDTKEGVWKMWAVLSKNGHTITYRTNRNLDSNWSSPKYLPCGSTNPWHIEVKYVGNKFVMMVNRRVDSSGYFLGISSDGENWKFSGTDLFTTTQPNLYKASFLPLFNSANELYFEVLYTVNGIIEGDLHRYMYNATTNAIAIEGI